MDLGDHLKVSIRIFAAVCVSFFLSVSAFAFDAGPDLQTPGEIQAAKEKVQQEFQGAVDPRLWSAARIRRTMQSYSHLDPNHEVPADLLEKAVTYFHANQSRFPNREFITIIDFKQHSQLPRFFVINMETGFVEKYRTAHGSGSDANDDGMAESFSNVIGSGASSLGYARTAEVYSGQFQRSIRLDGLSSTNSNFRDRAVVVHGWDGVIEQPIKQRRSLGCPALDWTVKDHVIDEIKEGSLVLFGVSE
jgi:hypothetical protein